MLGLVAAAVMLSRPPPPNVDHSRVHGPPPDPEAVDAKLAAAGKEASASAIPTRELAEETRRAIFTETLKAEARATAAVREPADSTSNPLAPPLVSGPERRAKQELKRKGRIELLLSQYRKEIALRHGISEDQVLAIVAEGRANHWPSQ